RITRIASRTQDESLLGTDGDTDFDTKLVGVARLAFADALHFRRMPSVDLVLALALLSAQLLGAFEYRLQPLQSLGRGLALNVPDQAPHDRALLANHSTHALVLPRMRVAAGAPCQARPHALIALAQVDVLTARRLHQLGTRRLQQATVGGMGDILFLYGAVDDYALEVAAGNGLEVLRRRNGLCQQPLHAFLTHPHAVARQRGVVARQAGLEHHLATKILKVRVLQPALTDRFVGQVVRVFEIQQPDHQPRRQRASAGTF